ncbi:MAG: hypothetical protein N2512_12070 [Armatimonadetes bacterium]|nr:hypothetical protein [Armatimonadota bacterium]
MAFLLMAAAQPGGQLASGSGPAVPAAAVTTRPYFPLQAGDRRMYLYANGDVADERTAGPITLDGHRVWSFTAVGHGSDRVVYCEDAGGATRMHGIDTDNMTIRFSPDATVLGNTADLGTTWHSEGRCIVDRIWAVPYSLDVTVQGVGVSCSTKAGEFADCLEIKILGRIGSEPDPDRIEETWWLARGVGLVKATDEVYPNESRELVYARIGDREYGVRPPAVGDFNADGKVDVEDARLLLEAYLSGRYGVEFDIYPYDFTPPDIIPRPDGLIDQMDLATFADLWRAYHPPAAP